MPVIDLLAQGFIGPTRSVIKGEVNKVLHVGNVCPDRVKVIAFGSVIIDDID